MLNFLCRQWSTEDTTTGIEFEDFKLLPLPALTVCAKRSVSDMEGGALTEEAYQASTYGPEEIFPSEKSNANWNISETRCGEMGRCYTLTTSRDVKAVSFDQDVVLKSGLDYNIYGK